MGLEERDANIRRPVCRRPMTEGPLPTEQDGRHPDPDGVLLGITIALGAMAWAAVLGVLGLLISRFIRA